MSSYMIPVNKLNKLYPNTKYSWRFKKPLVYEPVADIVLSFLQTFYQNYCKLILSVCNVIS